MSTLVKPNAVEQIESIALLAEQNKVSRTRVVDSLPIGKAVRQGDIYIHAVEKTHPHGKVASSSQLAQGNSRGSSHFAEAPAMVFEGTTLPAACAAKTFMGPYIESSQPFTISHPEHAHVTLGAGCYQITHQMDARTLQRVKD
jgi:hypothetical protein